MTNRLAIILFIIAILALVADATLNESAATLFMLKKFSDLTEWLAFWR
ncbi:MAG: glyceraldehyde-3-phosphate dehydrogenase [Vannielia sp.]|nr:glyceraldehyde-3-phosphate dehydrogenase [Oceanicola sp. 502str15]MCO6382517.1 glyceraldehyde-3-phosphate dehydrogenase [Oceanicola sp. 502str15]